MPLQAGDITNIKMTKVARIDPDGTRHNAWNVTFTVRGSTVASVEIPESEFSADVARQRVYEHAAEIVKVLEIT